MSFALRIKEAEEKAAAEFAERKHGLLVMDAFRASVISSLGQLEKDLSQ